VVAAEVPRDALTEARIVRETLGLSGDGEGAAGHVDD
jgi:hypothetical protein